MTVEEARAARVCRICGKAIHALGPKDAPLLFREMVYPIRVTFRFGDEFAHTACLEGLCDDSPPSASC